MALWHIQLLGGLRATRGNAVIAQFPSRPIAMLLARLALQPQRCHAREELIDLLWPEAELEVGRNRLGQALSTLRRLLEPPICRPIRS
jgi:DNA-binding SARP family transcriptional activator